MASKVWEEAVEELKKKRMEILCLEEKEPKVIEVANAAAERVSYDKSILVKVPKDDVHTVEIDGKWPVKGKGEEIDIPLFQQLLRAGGFYAEITEEKKEVVILEVSVRPIAPNADENKATTGEAEQDS